ncbi:hypothetical protein [Kineobactrum salinum]|uniref:Uncharacterized protein n=1 Tax=Kineobactrum salinum TaxID=2708301 RepID=A0A6C0U5W6_9GAMM|nr:hypothetical protein [Kineobactrum salinum]QIB65815.1 hypothetical protein G3T16_10685 [Kineobactrum salinum]
MSLSPRGMDLLAAVRPNAGLNPYLAPISLRRNRDLCHHRVAMDAMVLMQVSCGRHGCGAGA